MLRISSYEEKSVVQVREIADFVEHVKLVTIVHYRGDPALNSFETPENYYLFTQGRAAMTFVWFKFHEDYKPEKHSGNPNHCMFSSGFQMKTYNSRG